MSLKDSQAMILQLLKRWWREEEGLAATEAAMIFPMMCALLLGVFDIGNGILVNQKTIRASQVIADLVARESTISAASITEAVQAGRLAYEPLNTASYGVDIISMRFTDDSQTEIVWRETVNMSPIDDPAGAVAALVTANEGVVMVVVQYRYEPLFAGFVAQNIDMQETAFSRGRKSPVVNLES